MGMLLRAYAIGDVTGWDIEPAGPRREWMDAAPDRIPYRCLPMVMANQAGWVIRSPATFSATWNGGSAMADVKFAFGKGDEAHARTISAHFGLGIITFALPWLFRTAPGYGLLVRGPTNSWKDSAAPLDGVVETDWAPYTFTMNWKILRRNNPAWFQKGEPICMVCPFPLEMLESCEPESMPIGADRQADEDYTRFARARNQSLQQQTVDGSKPFAKDYYRGRRPDGTAVEEHRSNFKLKPFPKIGR